MGPALVAIHVRFEVAEGQLRSYARRPPLPPVPPLGSDYADQARAEIAPPLGATTYTLDSRRLLDQPGDESRSLAQSLTQLPGVALGPNGQLRVRGQ